MSVHLWYASLLRSAHEISRFEKLLSADEHKRAACFLKKPDRDRFVAGRGLLRMILGEYQQCAPQDITFYYNEYRKPSLSAEKNNYGLEFNLAHSEDALMIGITRHRRIGVDIERIYPDNDLTQRAKRFLSLAEQATFDTLSPLEQSKAWFQIWTVKEAYLKAVGTGLTQPLKSIEVSDATPIPGWYTETITRYDGFAAAMVLEGEPPSDIYYHHL